MTPCAAPTSELLFAVLLEFGDTQLGLSDWIVSEGPPMPPLCEATAAHHHAPPPPPTAAAPEAAAADGWQLVVPKKRHRGPPPAAGYEGAVANLRHVTHHREAGGGLSLANRAALGMPPARSAAPEDVCPCTVTLSPDSFAYQFAVAAAQASLPNIYIRSIQEVRNPNLVERFQRFVDCQSPCGELLWGFHGCGCDSCRGGEDAVRRIPQEGFRPGRNGCIYAAAKALYVDLGFASKTADGNHHQMILCQIYCAPRCIGGWHCCAFCWNHGPTAKVDCSDGILPRYIITYNCGHV
eukprot:EG_transcript_12008